MPGFLLTRVFPVLAVFSKCSFARDHGSNIQESVGSSPWVKGDIDGELVQGIRYSILVIEPELLNRDAQAADVTNSFRYFGTTDETVVGRNGERDEHRGDHEGHHQVEKTESFRSCHKPVLPNLFHKSQIRPVAAAQPARSASLSY